MLTRWQNMLLAVCGALWLYFLVPASPLAADDAPAASFEQSIAPILAGHCFKCHGGETPKAELNLSTADGILKGGESGAIFTAGKPQESLLYEVVAEGRMPPEGEPPLTPEEIQAIGDWIATGAELPRLPEAQPVAGLQDVVPILHLRCTVCHGLRKQEAELDLRTRESILKGGKSGPAIVPGDPAASLVLQKIHAGEMPPRRRVVEVSVKPMEPDEIQKLTDWIAGGAQPDLSEGTSGTATDAGIADVDRQFWSFQPPRAAPPPVVRDVNRVRTPIDAFLLEKLEEVGLTFSPEADRATLLRRAHFDLLGLPPGPELVQSFVSDPDPLAYERLIDRLLASPRYGERWSRYWLDVAGYSDSEGVQNSDPVRPNTWRYRDYVIRAFNADKPYDRFLSEQIAGDELADYQQAPEISQEIYDNLVATGFLRMAPDGTFAAITGFVPDRLDVINAEIDTLCSSVLGLTMRCARCHSHKFDPIPHRDYFRLAAIFKGAYDEHDWLKPNEGGQGSLGSFDVRDLPYVTSDERRAWESHEKSLDAEAQRIQAPLDEQASELIKKYTNMRVEQLPEAIRGDVLAMLETPADARNAVQKYLAEKFEATVRVTREQLSELDAPFKAAAEDAEKKLADIKARRQPPRTVRALWDRGQPSPTWVLRRGNYLTPGDFVEPGVPAALEKAAGGLNVIPPWPGATQTGRRLALARWLTQPNHPLTSRVMVNRVWKHHLGTGIVRTLDNFGRTGAAPTHPQLLDWLSVEFVRGGWSLKALHRLIMRSSVYRQSSSVTESHAALDPDNRLLSRMPLGRLEAEALADSLVMAAGQLNPRMYGSADLVDVRGDGLVTPRKGAAGWRRSIYVLQRRSEIPTILETFDLPRMGPNCVERTRSIVSSQALHLMNNALVRGWADAFAQRIAVAAGNDPIERIRVAYLIALGRPPSDEETRLGQEAIASLVEHWQRELSAAGNPAAGDPAAGDPVSGNAAGTGAAGTQAIERAWGNYCHALLNSAEFLFID